MCTHHRPGLGDITIWRMLEVTHWGQHLTRELSLTSTFVWLIQASKGELTRRSWWSAGADAGAAVLTADC